MAERLTKYGAEKVKSSARDSANELVEIIEAAQRQARRTGNTFVIDRQRVASMIAGRFIDIFPDIEAAIRADERERCEHRVEELDCLYINDERCPFGGIPADPETSIRREAIKECLAAIRSGGGE